MYKLIISTFLVILSCMNTSNIEAKANVQVNADITVNCFFTANILNKDGRKVYRIMSSSPRDCGAINELTGKLLESKVDLYCPRGYEPVGIPRGGPVGSYGRDVFYQAQGMCRAVYLLPFEDTNSVLKSNMLILNQ